MITIKNFIKISSNFFKIFTFTSSHGMFPWTQNTRHSACPSAAIHLVSLAGPLHSFNGDFLHSSLKRSMMEFFVSSAWAHASAAGQISWSSWSFSFSVMCGLSSLAYLYLHGWRKRKNDLGHLAFFGAAMVVLVAALLSPIDAMSEKLASVHMLQHTMLMMVAAPLLVLACPARYVPLGFSTAIRANKNFRWLLKVTLFRRPFLIWILYALTLWIWHLPILYEAALTNTLVHDLQHIAFFSTSFLFWRVVLEVKGEGGLNPGAGLIYLFVASLHAMILGVFMALSPVVWYAPYELSAVQFGLDPIIDQQIAGYIMWMPAGFTYFVVAVTLIHRLARPMRI